MPPKKSAKPKRKSGNENDPEPSTSGSPPKRQAAARAKKRVLQEKNDTDSDGDFDDETVEFRLSPKAPKTKKKTPSKKVTKTKAVPLIKTPQEKSQKTREMKKKKYLAEISHTVEQRLGSNNNLEKKTKNFYHLIEDRLSGSINKEKFTVNALDPLINNIAQFKVWRIKTPFERRITSVAWHPTKPGLACVGDKGGDLVLWNVHKELFTEKASGENDYEGKIVGRGPGGSIQSLKFDEISPHRVYIASIDGTVALKDFETKQDQEFLNTRDWNFWYTGLDVNFSGKTMVAGSNNGQVTLMTLDGQEIWMKKLHKSKCNFVQFSEREPWMVVTSSVDSVVKVWDIRNIKDVNSSIADLKHDKAVNSAYFSSTNGNKLLTTDQHSQLRIYEGPCWNLSKIIAHPHRQFQHMTPVKACWHPLADIPFAGRYPDPQFPGYQEGELRTIDFFNPVTGEAALKLHQPGIEKLITVNQFNPTGDFLLSGMSSSILIWRQGPPQIEEEEEKKAQDSEVGKPQPTSGANFWPELGKKTKKAKEKKQK